MTCVMLGVSMHAYLEEVAVSWLRCWAAKLSEQYTMWTT